MKTLVILSGLFFLSHQTFSQDSIPELNKKIIAFVNKNVGKKVDRGECWDLVAIPLNENNADWDGEYAFGNKIDYKKDTVYPGDIIQFEKVILKYTEGNKSYTVNLYHHTAVVYEVLGPGNFKVAEQNTEKGKKVTLDDLNLNKLTKGKVQFYRPVPNK